MLIVPKQPCALHWRALKYRNEVKNEGVENVENNQGVYGGLNSSDGALEDLEIKEKDRNLGQCCGWEVDYFVPVIQLMALCQTTIYTGEYRVNVHIKLR